MQQALAGKLHSPNCLAVGNCFRSTPRSAPSRRRGRASFRILAAEPVRSYICSSPDPAAATIPKRNQGCVPKSRRLSLLSYPSAVFRIVMPNDKGNASPMGLLLKPVQQSVPHRLSLHSMNT